MHFLFLFPLCSAIVLHGGKAYRNFEITSLLSSSQASAVDISSLDSEEVRFIPPQFVASATPDQWRRLVQLGFTSKWSEPARKAFNERLERENEIARAERRKRMSKTPRRKETDTVLSTIQERPVVIPADQEYEAELYGFSFTDIPHEFESPKQLNSAGPNLMRDRGKSIHSLFKEVDRFYIDVGPINVIRTRAFNFLMGKFPATETNAEDHRILLDWAHIALIFSYGLRRDTGAYDLIEWFKSLSLFNLRCKNVPISSWTSLLHRCKETNKDLWNSMLKLAIARIKEDPDLVNLDPYANLAVNVGPSPSVESDTYLIRPVPEHQNWIPSLNPQMENILRLKAPDTKRLPKLEPIGEGYRTPFLLHDPPGIAKIFQTQSFIVSGKMVKGHEFRRYIALQYRILKGWRRVEDEQAMQLVTEWAMITLIFNTADLSPAHNLFIRWLKGIPMDFARLYLSESKGLSWQQSFELIKQGRDANPELWDAMAFLAVNRFLADPQREPLPALEKWCLQRGIIADTAEVEDLSTILDRMEQELDSPSVSHQKVRALFKQVLASLFQTEVPHASLFAKEIGKLIEQMTPKREFYPFADYPYTEVANPYEKASHPRTGIPNLMTDRHLELDSLFTFSEQTEAYKESDLAKRNDLRRRGWNFLKEKLIKFDDLRQRDHRLLVDWALIGVVCSNGLRKRTNARKAIKWLKSVGIFSKDSMVPLKSWLRLLHRFRQANEQLWKGMAEFSLERVREDPTYADYDPYFRISEDERGTDDESSETEEDEEVAREKEAHLTFGRWIPAGMEKRNWIPALDEKIKALQCLESPTLRSLWSIKLPKIPLIAHSTIPFLKFDPPRIAQVFQQFSVRLHDRIIPGSFFRKHIVRQYALLKDEVKLNIFEAERLLVAEWAMITLIFQGNNVIKPHERYLWLHRIPSDFARKNISKRGAPEVSLEKSVELLKLARSLAPELWDALASFAANLFLADPARESLPLLESWCAAKGIEVAALSKAPSVRVVKSGSNLKVIIRIRKPE